MRKIYLALLTVFILLFPISSVCASEEVSGETTVSSGESTAPSEETATPSEEQQTPVLNADAIPMVISAKSVDYRSVQISWKEVPGAESYTVYYKPKAGKKWSKVKTNLKGTTFLHKSSKKSPLVTGQAYSYSVQAVSGSVSTLYDQVGKSAKPVPESARLRSVVSKAYDRLQITWDKVPGASGYYVFRKEGSSWKRVASVKSNSYLHISSNKFPIRTGQTYTYTVRAYRTVNGAGVKGTYDHAGISGKTIPGKPVVKKIEYDVNRKIVITWKQVPGATGYVVYRKSGSTWNKAATITGSGNTEYSSASTTKFPIKEGNTYTYSIRSYTSTGKTYGKMDKKGVSLRAVNPAIAEVERAKKNAENIVRQITTPSMSQSQKLRKCFDWVMAKPYVTRRQFARTPGWTAYFANDHFVLGGGNCHSDACAFGYLAKALGYKNVYVCTDTTGTQGAHSWTEVDGLYYDPLFAQAKSFSRYYAVRSFPLGVRTREEIK